jgi:glycosyltransferase involved in cell wall biosynthesis
MFFMRKKEAIVVGWINTGKPADCGETMKNQLLIQKLESMDVRCHQIDFKNWREHPWVFLKLAFCLLFKKKATLIFSSSATNVYPFMKLLKQIHWEMNCIHWVIGGNLGDCVKVGKYKIEYLNYATHTLVESPLMVSELSRMGLKNVKMVPNFKPIPYFPSIDKKRKKRDGLTKFVFLSRIMQEKGCAYILEAAQILNADGFENKYIIDFYGKIADSFDKEFKHLISNLPNAHYHGFLNLRDKEGYDKLATYDIMLFPTYWRGEGFAGVFMDAFISGVPMIVTEWAHNAQFMENGKTALFVPVHDVDAISKKMRECIENRHDLILMANNCQMEANKYNVDNVITKEFLQTVGL